MTGPDTPPDFVTNKTLYDELGKLRDAIITRREVWLILLGGQAVASGVTALVTKLSPPQQVAALAHFFYGLVG